MDQITRWRPFTEMTGLQRDMNDVFDRFFGRSESGLSSTGSWFPVTNVSETPDNIIVTAEVPGMEAKDLDVSITGDVLTLKGEKKQEKEEKNESFQRVERSYGTFTRSFRLPATVVADKVAADYKNGILRLTMPKTDESRRREIKIKVG